MKNKKIRVGGVPEHFNLPWHLAIENELFKKEGVEVEWHTFKGGTGQMTKALRNDEIDVCILLTEGIVADIINGNPSKIISKYLTTPLIWGVYTGANNSVNHYGEIYKERYELKKYEIIHSLNTLEKTLIELKDDLFVNIEHPYVDKIYRDGYYKYFASKRESYSRDTIRLSFFNEIPIL